MQFFLSFLEKVTQPKLPDSLLVIEATFTQLKGFVVEKNGENLAAKYDASSSASNYEQALEEVIKQVKDAGWQGEYAIMTSPAVCLTTLDLNIPPKNKLLPLQVADAVNWELEPVYTQHKNVLTIGQLLQLTGYLTFEQASEILAQQEVLINSKERAVVFKRFGELAIDLGYVNHVQLDECLERQKWFKTDVGSLKSGWHALPNAEQYVNEDGQYKWVVSGIDQGVLREWQAAAGKHQVKLERFYPLVGGGLLELPNKPPEQAATTSKKKKENKEVLLELADGLMMATVLTDNLPLKNQIAPVTKESLLGSINELIEALHEEDGLSISLIDYISQNEHEASQLMVDIESLTGREVKAVNIKPSKIGAPQRHAIRHFLQQDYAGNVQDVSVHEPLPPVLQRFKARAIVASIVALAAMGIAELSWLGMQFSKQMQIDKISEDVSRIRGEIKRIDKKIKNVNQLNAEIDAKTVEKNRAQSMFGLLTTELPERNKLLIQLMDALESSINDDVVVNSITEDTLLGFNYSAWALTESSAQAFIKRFQVSISPMGFRVKNVIVSQSGGRLGLIGYSIQFSITSLDEKTYRKRKAVKRIKRYL